jgi:hypothetical protein
VKRFAAPSKPDVAVPVVVVAVHIHFALVTVPVEVRVVLYRKPSLSPLLEIFYNLELNFISHQNAGVFCTKYLHFLILTHTLYLEPNFRYSQYADTGFGRERFLAFTD